MTAPAAPIAVVTGGAGFIGSHMVDLLRDRGIAVRVLDNLVGGRADNLAHHQNDAQVTLDTRDMVTVAGDDAFYADADYVSISPASATLCRRSTNRSTTCAPM